jgi:hypothetical protein
LGLNKLTLKELRVSVFNFEKEYAKEIFDAKPEE